jgi:hypothetical protein
LFKALETVIVPTPAFIATSTIVIRFVSVALRELEVFAPLEGRGFDFARVSATVAFVGCFYTMSGFFGLRLTGQPQIL